MTYDERLQLFLSDSSISKFPGLAEKICNFEVENELFLNEYSPGNYIVEYPFPMVLGRIGEFFFAGLETSNEDWLYQLFLTKSKLKYYFVNDVLTNETLERKKFWASEIDSIPNE